MTRYIGLPELFVLPFVAALLAAVILPVWRIVSKTGYAGALSLLLFLPVINFFVILFLALSEWPIERELKALRRRLPSQLS